MYVVITRKSSFPDNSFSHSFVSGDRELITPDYLWGHAGQDEEDIHMVEQDEDSILSTNSVATKVVSSTTTHILHMHTHACIPQVHVGCRQCVACTQHTQQAIYTSHTYMRYS